jgi:hypothetical protein
MQDFIPEGIAIPELGLDASRSLNMTRTIGGGNAPQPAIGAEVRSVFRMQRR